MAKAYKYTIKQFNGTDWDILYPKTIADQVIENENKRFTSDVEIDSKVDKELGKQLSTEDFTTDEKDKLANIENGANNYIHPPTHDVTEITGLSNVATSGDYDDLLNKPTLGTASSYDVGISPYQIPMIQVNGKIDSNIIPSLAITDTYVVSSLDDMLFLDVQVGDVVVRTDENKSYILHSLPSNDLLSWQELLSPLDLIQSVNGKVGTVLIDKNDVGLGNVDNESKATMFNNPRFTGIPKSPTPSVYDDSTQIATTAFVQEVVDLNTEGLKERYIVYYLADRVDLGLQNPRFPIPFNCKIKQLTVSIGQPSESPIQFNLQKINFDKNWIDLLSESIIILDNDDYHEYTLIEDIQLLKGDRLGVMIEDTSGDARNMTITVAIERI